jgi:hypothetical protein
LLAEVVLVSVVLVSVVSVAVVLVAVMLVLVGTGAIAGGADDDVLGRQSTVIPRAPSSGFAAATVFPISALQCRLSPGAKALFVDS